MAAADVALRVLKEHVDGVPSPATIRRVRAKLKLSQRAAGAVFKVGPSAFDTYERGLIDPSGLTIQLITLLDRHPELIADLRATGHSRGPGLQALKAQVINGSAPNNYFVWGQNYIVIPALLGNFTELDQVIDFVRQDNKIAISYDMLASSPSFVILTYQVMPGDKLLLTSYFDGTLGYMEPPGGQPFSKCPAAPMFRGHLAEANKPGSPSMTELSQNSGMFDDMPPVDGIKWAP